MRQAAAVARAMDCEKRYLHRSLSLRRLHAEIGEARFRGRIARIERENFLEIGGGALAIAGACESLAPAYESLGVLRIELDDAVEIDPRIGRIEDGRGFEVGDRI